MGSEEEVTEPEEDSSYGVPHDDYDYHSSVHVLVHVRVHGRVLVGV